MKDQINELLEISKPCGATQQWTNHLQNQDPKLMHWLPIHDLERSNSSIGDRM